MMNNNECFHELIHYTHGVTRSELKKWQYESLEDLELQERVDENVICVLHSKSPSRHFKLKRLVNAPYLVTGIWDISLLDRSLLAVVWPRKSSLYAMQVVEDLFASCVDYNMVTISGWAMGVDMLCHKKSLEFSIPTIVVLWEWLRYAMQWAKKSFIQQVVNSWWLVLSEFPLDMPPTKRSFPQRNRIVSWMSEMVFVPAAWKKSGSLISVDFASQMHIPVYSVPWSIYDATSAWTNEYLSTGTIQWVVDFDSMLSKYFTNKAEEWRNSSHDILQLTVQQQALLQKLPATKNSLMAQWIPLADISMLEIWGWVKTNEKWELVKK
jgi:DNA processing protein